ncbi:MAG: V-type ATPase subunit [Candidatus Kaiserbacteria bacterium]|nr:V-type ATPase subunit [Candidatus Kaiserbacteria bacterium]MCB9816183.1 V-type ATPase subunit [Candidatus Nomurabacteria bacterium]
MQTSYIYSVSRVNALTQFLLSKTDVERLLVADPGEDLQSALKETYLAPYVLRVPNESVPLAVEQTLIDAKRLIHKLAPKGDMFRIMWVQYDVHNLRVFAKAAAKGLSYEDCKPYLSERGIYQPEYLYAQIEARALASLQIEWQKAYDAAVELSTAGKLDEVDGVFDELYFTTSKRIVDTLGDAFMKTYFATLVDLYNLKSRLRHLKNDVSFSPSFVTGGTFAADAIETEEATLAMFARHGGVEYWKNALEYFTATGNFTQIDARSADCLLAVAKEASYDMFSSASLVLYYLKCRQAAANVRAIVVGKNNGLTVEDIRSNLRLAYVND